MCLCIFLKVTLWERKEWLYGYTGEMRPEKFLQLLENHVTKLKLNEESWITDTAYKS
jgi:hypothetical protein